MRITHLPNGDRSILILDDGKYSITAHSSDRGFQVGIEVEGIEGHVAAIGVKPDGSVSLVGDFGEIAEDSEHVFAQEDDPSVVESLLPEVDDDEDGAAEQIRQYLSDSPSASNKEVVSALAERGVKVVSQDVTVVRKAMKSEEGE